ncbi:MAG: CYTH domain-containing protein [Tangfeifania sp.]
MVEIERKFLVDAKKWQPSGNGIKIKQGYLLSNSQKTVRARIKGPQAFLTIKGKPEGIKRTELEYEIPLKDAGILLEMVDGFPVEKTRYIEKRGDFTWEIDVFEGKNKVLILAEVELENENQQPELPEWATMEVSEDERYFNYYLSKKPFSEW